MSPADEMAAKPNAAGSEKSDQQLRATLENLEHAVQQNPVEKDELLGSGDFRPGITSYLDNEASERKAIYDRLVAIENQMKRRGSRGFVRYLVAILIGIAATLAWQSYGDAAKQVIATKGPELGWSPEAKQMIASWTPGWKKPPASPEKIAPETAVPKAPPAPSLDPAQVQQITQSLAAMRETLQELAGSQGSMARDVARLESAVAEILLKIPEPPPQSPVVPARKPTPVPPSSRAPIAPPSSRTTIPPRQ
jgi:hypothetical protein